MNKSDRVTIHPSSQFAGFYKKLPQRIEIKEYLKERRKELSAAVTIYQAGRLTNRSTLRWLQGRFDEVDQTIRWLEGQESEV